MACTFYIPSLQLKTLVPRPHPKQIGIPWTKPLHWYTEQSPRDSYVHPELKPTGRRIQVLIQTDLEGEEPNIQQQPREAGYLTSVTNSSATLIQTTREPAGGHVLLLPFSFLCPHKIAMALKDASVCICSLFKDQVVPQEESKGNEKDFLNFF